MNLPSYSQSVSFKKDILYVLLIIYQKCVAQQALWKNPYEEMRAGQWHLCNGVFYEIDWKCLFTVNNTGMAAEPFKLSVFIQTRHGGRQLGKAACVHKKLHFQRYQMISTSAHQISVAEVSTALAPGIIWVKCSASARSVNNIGHLIWRSFGGHISIVCQ